MYDLENNDVAVIGLDASASAACEYLLKQGARVWALHATGTEASQKGTLKLKNPNFRVIEETELPSSVSLAVHGAQASRNHPLLRRLGEKGVPVVSDLELASPNICCLNIAIAGTNGKTTTAELVAEMLSQSQRKTVRAGASGSAICEVAEQSRDLDFLTLDVNSYQAESIEYFRPAVAVLTNLKPEDQENYGSMREYAQAVSKIFKNQQPFDWAIVQCEALAHLRSIGVEIPSKVITYSANNRRADIFLDRGLLISSLPNWTGPLFNMEQSRLRGPHNAENVMAALAVGRVLRLKLEEMVAAIKGYRPGPHRLELVGEAAGVEFINNSKAMNPDSLAQSIEALPPAPAGEPNIWLIAGGRDTGLDYHDAGPLLARRVKGAFLLGESREKLRASWSLFTPCTLVKSLLEAVSKSAENAVEGDVVLLSPACSSLDMFQSYQHRGESFREAVNQIIQQNGSGRKKSAPVQTK